MHSYIKYISNEGNCQLNIGITEYFFWLWHNAMLLEDTDASEEHTACIFRVEACMVKIQFDYMGSLEG